MFRDLMMTTAVVAAFSGAAAIAQDTAGNIQPFSFNIEPFVGDIAAFGGDITAFNGDITAFRGDINAFAGQFNPLYGDITPFYGDISPFWGNIEPFWGDITPFSNDIAAFGGDIQAFSSDMHPFWGNIEPFEKGDPVNGGLATYWSEVGPMWGDIYSFWSDVNSSKKVSNSDAAAIQSQLQGMISFSDAAWGDVVAEKTGMTFDAFADQIMGEFGIDPDNAKSLIGVDGATRSAFFLAWYDRLMGLTGMDQVDYWMPMINWNPALSQDQGEGHDARVGLLDMAIAKSDHSVEFLQAIGGYSDMGSGHGAAVASLIAARHGDEGVMGIAPRATVFAYNPFDDSGTASVADVAIGLRALAERDVNVINMSLGVPGAAFHQDMADIFTHPELQQYADALTVVTAAGNDGVAQSGVVDWGTDGLGTTNLLIVGSVGPSGQISQFSNTPGDACFAGPNGCKEMLMDRFIVAPGENLLVSDNQGGTMRASGTSFAAPLVTGTISLMHDYWPWLQENPEATTEIILTTAQDLGEEGVDAVYGHGLLDAEAALSPIDFNDLIVFLDDGSSIRFSNSVALAQMAIDPGTLDLWEADGAAIYAFEFVAGTRRDFSIPLSTLLIGQESILATYQRHVQRRFLDWAQSTQGFSGNVQTLAANEQWNLTFKELGGSLGAGMMTFTSEEHGFSVRSGWGEGLQNLSTVDSFRQREDFDPQRGGANPLLGLAQGGSFAAMTFDLGSNMSLNFGMSGTPIDDLELNPFTGQVDQENVAFGARDAVATFAEFSMAATPKLTVSTAVSGLTEQRGVFGSQGTGALGIENEVRSSGLTLTARYALTDRIALAGTATGARAFAPGQAGAGLSVGEEGLTASSFQLNMEVDDLFSEHGRLTISAMQPLHVETGGLAFTAQEVTDRSTGATDLVTNQWSLGGTPRHLAAEIDYSFALPGNRLELGMFSRYDVNDVDIQGRFNAASVGARLGLTF